MIRQSSRNQAELGKILDLCLELIASGYRTVDSVIEQYPEHSEVLRPPLEAAQWLQKRTEVFNPRPGFVHLSRRRLTNRFQGYAGSSSTETMSRIPAFFQERRMVVQYSALLTLTAVLLFVGYRSTSFLVQRSIPGDPLYETKLAHEKLRLNLSFSEEKDTRLRLEYAQRRVIEMQELVLEGRDAFLDQTLDNFKFQMAEVASGILTIAKIDPIGAAVLTTLFEETLTVPVRNLVSILDTTPEITSVEFVNSLNTLTAEILDQPLYDFLLVLSTSTPTNTLTVTFTPTEVFTSTFTSTTFAFAEPTSTVQPNNTLPAADPTTPGPTNTSPPRIEPTATPTLQPTSPSPPPPEPTNTPIPPVEPTNTPPPTVEPTSTPVPTVEPTSTPKSTVEPTNTPQPSPTDDDPEKPTKTKKPKPTQHPTYRPTQEN